MAQRTEDVMSLLQNEEATLSVSRNTKKLLKLFAEISDLQDRANETAAEVFGAESKEFDTLDNQIASCRQYLKKKITDQIFENVFSSKSTAI